MPLSPGTRLGAYEVVAALGKGGMGEVYRARDTRLGREVAIKVLPAVDAASVDRRARFAREARAVAALNHPNICTLHDVGEQDGHDFLVMELLQGETLAARLARAGGPLPMREALEIGAAIAAALAAAHDAGFVHRDLKPANVMLTPHGVKVLDFGLARALAAPAVDAMTVTDAHTSAGIVLGTLPYMAPEQVEGHATDARTDIFALGAVLYELLTGVRPFQGDSTARLTAAILTADPTPLTESAPLTPTAIDRLVRKCLSKVPAARWQSARDVADELRWITSTLTPASGATGGATADPGSSSGAGAAAGSAPASGGVSSSANDARGAAGSVSDGGHSSTSGLGSSVSPSRSWRRLALAAVAAAAIAAVVFGTRPWSESRSTEPASPAATQATPTVGTQARHTQVTFDGNVQEVALSPDGQSIAYTAALGNGMTGIFVRDVAGGQPLELSRHQFVLNVQWSPDGVRIFVSTIDGSSGRALISLPRFGGAPQRVGRCPTFAVSPDGRAIACVFTDTRASEVRILDADGTERRRIPHPPNQWLYELVWVDNQRIASRGVLENGDTAIFLVPLEGAATVVATGGTEPFRLLASESESSALYALRQRGGAFDLVRLPTESPGSVVTVLAGLAGFAGGSGQLSISRGGRRLSHVRGVAASNLWVAQGSSPPRALTRGSIRLSSPTVSDDGRTLVATAFSNATPSVVRIDDAGTVTSITSGKWGAISPDGTELAFLSTRSGRSAVWLSRPDGSGGREVDQSGAVQLPWWHSAGRLMWQLGDLGGYAIFDLKSRAVEEMPLEAPGVRWWLHRFLVAPAGDRAVVWVNGSRGIRSLLYRFEERTLVDIPPLGDFSPVSWLNSSTVLAANDLGRQIFRVPLSGSQKELVATFPGSIDAGCASARAGRYIVCAVDESRSDAWIIDDFDPQVSPRPQ